MLGHQPCHTQILSCYIYQDQSSVYLIVCCIFTTLKPICMSCWCWHRSRSPVPSAFPAFPWLWCRGAPLRTSFISSLNEAGFQSASVGLGPLVFLFSVQIKGTKQFFLLFFGGNMSTVWVMARLCTGCMPQVSPAAADAAPTGNTRGMRLLTLLSEPF